MDPVPRILAVDGERLMRMSLRHHLGATGYEVVTAASVREALGRLDSQTFDLILAEWSLPDGSGLEVVAYAKRLNPRARSVLLAGSTEESPEGEALSAGADAILAVPCSLHRLAAEAGRVLEGRPSPVDPAR
jgi:CheY-like chemotaxis protein